jgi:hypothetical protein
LDGLDGCAGEEAVGTREDDGFAAGEAGEDLDCGVRLQTDTDRAALSPTVPGYPDERSFR